MVMPTWSPPPNAMAVANDPAPLSSVINGTMRFTPNNTIDIGVPATGQPRNLNLGSDLTMGGAISIQGQILLNSSNFYGLKFTSAGPTLLGNFGAPNNANGSNGDFYLRNDTPGTANQRLYVKIAGAWTGIL